MMVLYSPSSFAILHSAVVVVVVAGIAPQIIGLSLFVERNNIAAPR